MAKKRILLYSDSYGGRVGISESYVEFLSQFGEVILVSADNDLAFFASEIGDVLAMPGGADIDPARYGEPPSSSYGRTNPHFEYLDEFLLQNLWIPSGKPIVGICRGMQSLNVALGGSLHQHIYGHQGGEDRSSTPFKMYTDIEGYEIYATNSYHHQACQRIAANVEVIGWSPAYKHCPTLKKKETLFKHSYEKKKNGDLKIRMSPLRPQEEEMFYSIPEIIRHRTLPYIGFQYHPEEFNCPLAVELINEVLEIDQE